MPAGSVTLHEAAERLGPEVVDRHRAIVSLMEELEAIDWYDQRVHASDDPELAAVLAHNRDEEKEHAVMALEWLRRHDPVLDAKLREILFKDGPISGDHGDHAGAGAGGQAPAAEGSLGIGSLKGAARPASSAHPPARNAAAALGDDYGGP